MIVLQRLSTVSTIPDLMQAEIEATLARWRQSLHTEVGFSASGMRLRRQYQRSAALGLAVALAGMPPVAEAAWADASVNLDAPPATPPSAAAAPVDNSAALPPDEIYAIHGQTTFVDQYHPAFASAYRGANSLDPGSRGDETWDLTLFLGVRPWSGAELWVNPEIDQGFGLSNTLGVAGFTSAEAYKVGDSEAYVRVPRLFLRQTIDLGGAPDTQAPAANQLAQPHTEDRIVVTVGKFGVVDVFDTNSLAHDPRSDFLNWAVVDSGAFDYAADAWGYTYGGAVEWYQNWWTLRGGAFVGSVTPNSKFLDLRPGQQFQLVTEAEARTTLFGEAGAIRVLGFQTRALLAKFSELEAFYAANPNATNVQAESIRRLRNKFGAALNIEQHITADLGAFLRASFNDGRTEAYDFTDIDQSLAVGLSLAGTRWGRPDDTVGVAGVVDQIDNSEKRYLEQGGLGILVGDGRLTNAGPEQIIETYYQYSLRPGIAVTADYQFIKNPAYNRDRGPVSILGGRLHLQF
jgi:high affinity Mn2+ porin